MVLPVPLVLLAPLALLVRRAIRVRKARLGRRAIVDRLVPMASEVRLALPVLLAHAVLMELLALSGQKASPVLPDPRGGLDHKGRLVRRVTLENVVLRVNVERLALLVLPVLLAHAVLMELLALSGQKASPVLPDPRGGLDHKGRLVRRVTLENVVLRVNVERLALLVLPVLLAHAVLMEKVVTSSGTRSR